MIVDNVPSNSLVRRTKGSGDTGRKRVEHRSILLLWITHILCKI